MDRFKISNDPRFEEKLTDVVGLYLNPPARAVVFSFDEKTQCQALDRTQPSLPMKRGRAGTMTHDYKRHGTTDLFAALNVATGEVLYDTRKQHTAKDVLRFFKLIDLHVPKHLDIHVILDNLSAHSAPEVTEWLAHPRRARWHLHFVPTSSSWLNLVERWFKELTDRMLRRGVFCSLPALIDAIELWVEHWNDDPKPFVWHAEADKIIEKVRRGREHRVSALGRLAQMFGGLQAEQDPPPNTDLPPGGWERTATAMRALPEAPVTMVGPDREPRSAALVTRVTPRPSPGSTTRRGSRRTPSRRSTSTPRCCATHWRRATSRQPTPWHRRSLAGVSGPSTTSARACAFLCSDGL